MNCGADTYTWPSPLGSKAIEGSPPDQYGCLVGSPFGSWLSGPKASEPACAADAKHAARRTNRIVVRWSMPGGYPAPGGATPVPGPVALLVPRWSATARVDRARG